MFSLSCLAWSAALVADEHDKTLLPEPGALSRGASGTDLQGTLRGLDTVIDSAARSQLQAVDHNHSYNQQRKIEIDRELIAAQRAVQRLDDLAGLQYERIRVRFDDETSPDYLAAVQKLSRQHEATRSGLERQIATLAEQRAEVDARLVAGAVQREVLQVRRELNRPFQLEDPPRGPPEPSPESLRALDYLRQLSNVRIHRNVGQIVELQPLPVERFVLEEMIGK